MKAFLPFLFLLCGLIESAFAQMESQGYSYITDVYPESDRKMKANELMFVRDDAYLIVNYGFRPTFLVVYTVGDWEPVQTFRLSDWVEFSGAYFYPDSNCFYVQRARYSSDYYALSLKTGDYKLVDCEQTPLQCPRVEPDKPQLEAYSQNGFYCVQINKKNPRELRVFEKQ